MKKTFVMLVLLSSSLLAEHPSSFSNAKKAMYKVWSSNPKTFYCDCDYSRANRKNMIDRSTCGYVPRNEFTRKGKPNKRARRTEAEHVVPAENFYRQLPCSRTTKRERGNKSKREYCYETDERFRKFHDDPINLVPAIGELNADRSNFRYGALEPAPGQYGECRFEVDFSSRKAYVKPDIKGDIARIYFYVSSKYGMKISKTDMRILKVWDKSDPVDRWEEYRTQVIDTYYH